VSADTWAANGGFAEAQGLTFPLLSDWPEYRTIAAFGGAREGTTVAARATFVFDSAGVVQAVIDDARDMEAHTRGALEAMRRLSEAGSDRG